MSSSRTASMATTSMAASRRPSDCARSRLCAARSAREDPGAIESLAFTVFTEAHEVFLVSVISALGARLSAWGPDYALRCCEFVREAESQKPSVIAPSPDSAWTGRRRPPPIP